MKRYRVRGPKGGTIAPHAPEGKLGKLVPKWLRRYRSVTIEAPSSSPAKPSKSEVVRGKIVAYCRWGIAHEPRIHYAESRPIPLGRRRRLPLTTDCSGFATCAYRDAGAPDPNGQSYSGQGYTGTMLDHGRSVSKKKAKAGDLCIFGPGTGHHVVVLLEDGTANGGDPVVASHGQEAGPVALRLSEEARYQPKPIRFRTYLED